MDYMDKDVEAELLKEIEAAAPPKPEKIPLGRLLIEFFSFYRWQTIATVAVVALSVALAFPVYRRGDANAIKELAQNKLNNDIDYLNGEYDKLKASKAQIENNLYNLKSNIEQDGHINKEIAENEEALAELSAKISAANAKIEDLNEKIAEKKDLSRQVGAVGTEVSGKSKTVVKGKYHCPDDYSAGTYKMSAKSASVLIYNAQNKLRMTQILDNSDYTVSLQDGEWFEVTGTVTKQPIG